MAEVTIDIRINTANAATGLKDLRKSLKDLVSAQAEVGAGTANFVKLQDSINKTEEKLSNLTDAFGTLRGSGVERLNNSFALLRDGFASVDPDKIKIAMQGLGAAMKAIPIFLLVEGIRLLIENFDKLVSFAKELTGGFTEEEKKLTSLTEAYNRQIDASKLLQAQLENEIALAIAQKKPLEEILDLQNKLYDQKIKQAQAQVEINKATVEATKTEFSFKETLMATFGFMIGSNDIMISAFKDRANKVGEANKKVTDSEIELNKIQNDKVVNTINTNNKISEEARKASENRIKSFQDQLAFNQKAQEDYDASILKEKEKAHEDELKLAQEEIADAQKKEDEIRKAEEDHFKIYNKLSQDNLAQRLKDNEAAAAAELAITIKKQQAIKSAISTDTQTLQGIYAGYYNNKLVKLNNASNAELNKVRGNADAEYQINLKKFNEEQKIKKQAFEADKSFKMATAIINGAASVLETMASVPYPVNIPLAIAQAGLAAAQVAIIAESEFEEGAAPSPPQISASGGGGDGGGNSVSTPDPKRNFNPNAIETNAQGQRVWVTQHDIVTTIKKVQVIEQRATFP